jgi:hypothetical protein
MADLYAASLLRVHKGSVTDEHGTPLATLQDRGRMGWRKALDGIDPGSASGFARTVDVVDPWGRPYFTVRRDSSHVRRAVTHVLRPDGLSFGSIQLSTRKGLAFHDAQGNVIGAMRSVAALPSGTPAVLKRGIRGFVQSAVAGGTYDITDRLGTVCGRVDHDKTWLASDEDPHTVRVEQAAPEPLRTLGLAAGLCLWIVRGV